MFYNRHKRRWEIRKGGKVVFAHTRREAEEKEKEANKLMEVKE